ncbi:MAG: ATP-binding protein, partial [Mycobacteriales bacterium]
SRLPAGLPTSLLSKRLTGPALARPVEEVLVEFSIPAPDGARLLQMGAPAHAEEGCLCAGHATVSAVLEALNAAGRTTVVDLEASPEHLSRGTARHVDLMLLVTEAYYRSLETVRRLAGLAGELPIGRIGVLANKLRSPEETRTVAEFCAHHQLELLGALPHSGGALEADLAGTAVVDHPDADPFVLALGSLLPLFAG